MFAEQIRQAAMASPRVELPKVSAALWKAYAAGTVTEAEASALSDLIETRKAIPAPQRPAQRRVGSRPRSPPAWSGGAHGPLLGGCHVSCTEDENGKHWFAFDDRQIEGLVFTFSHLVKMINEVHSSYHARDLRYRPEREA